MEFEGMARHCREYAVLSVRPRLRANGVVVGDDVNAFHPQTESQGLGQRQIRRFTAKYSLDRAVRHRGTFRIENSFSG
jgi:hypothetical protein